MNEKMQIKPSIRFSNFAEPWYIIKLGDLLDFKNGVNEDKSAYGSGYKFINVMDILSTSTITHDKIKGKVNISPSDFEKFKVVYGDILFQRSSETREDVGKANVYLDSQETATFGGFVIRGQSIAEYNPQFMRSLLSTSSSRKEIMSKSGGSTRYNVGQETLQSVKIVL